MEVSPTTKENTVRVMRFSFDANESLRDQLAQQIDERWRYMTPLSFYASRQLVLPVESAYLHKEELQILGKEFQDKSNPIVIQPQIRSKIIDHRLTRFQLVPKNQITFDHMVSLDIYPHPSRFNSDTSRQPEKIENLIQQPKTGHYLFVDIATKVLVDERHLRAEEAMFAEKAKKGKFWLQPQRLHTVRDIRYTAKAEAGSEDNSNVVDGVSGYQ